MIDKRKIFFEELIKLAEQDDKILLIVPDVGFSFTETFAEKFPTRYFNFGVTEQSCVVIASALALSGFKPYVYSMINFVITRPYEMVRNAICMHKANVKLIGVQGSAGYRFLGFSHNMLYTDEDVHLLKPLPNIDTFIPETENDVRKVIQESYLKQKASYTRV